MGRKRKPGRPKGSSKKKGRKKRKPGRPRKTPKRTGRTARRKKVKDLPPRVKSGKNKGRFKKRG